MKMNIKISYFVSLLALACLLGCADKDNVQLPDSDSDLITLRADIGELSADVDTDVQTKAPVLTWKNTKVSFAYGDVANNYTNNHWDAFILVHGDVIFSPVRPYDAADKVMHLKGFHPRGEMRNNDYNKVYFTLTGQEDLMVSQDINVGKLSEKIMDDVARFEHKLSQFRFKVVNSINSGTTSGIYPIVAKLYKISVSGTTGNPLRSDVMLDLTDNSVAFSGTPATYTAYENTSGLPLSYSSDLLPGNQIPVMFEPGKSIAVTVEYSGADDVRKVVTKDVVKLPEPGKAYEITINFTSYAVQVNYTLTAWQSVSPTNEVTGGSVTLW